MKVCIMQHCGEAVKSETLFCAVTPPHQQSSKSNKISLNTFHGGNMRKAIILTLLCIIALSFAYAGKTDIVVQVSPYSMQTVITPNEKYVSTYGFGAQFGFRTNVFDNLTAGLDVDVSIYKYAELDNDYDVAGFRAVVGYSYEFIPKLSAEADIGIGFDLRKVGTVSKIYFGIDAYLGFIYALKDEFKVTLGADLGLGFQPGKKSSSTDFAVKTQAGLLLSL